MVVLLATNHDHVVLCRISFLLSLKVVHSIAHLFEKWKCSWKVFQRINSVKTSQRSKPVDISLAFSRKKKITFIFLTLSVPFIFFAILEVVLRLSNYGPNLALFTTETVSGKTYYIMNPDVKGRYFSRTEFSPNTSPDYFQAPKSPGTYRIFCLGGSTTVGFPYGYIGSFSTFLRERLRSVFPEKNIEVINVGMTATNSYTTLDIVRELVNYEPDLFIVYDGHNEFYGALGLASREAIGSVRWMTNLYLRLVHLRTFHLMRDWIARLVEAVNSTPSSTAPGTMMERLAYGQHIPHGTQKYDDCLRIFQANLQEFCEIARQKNIPVILSTQVSNLRDQAPFVSEFLPELSEEKKRSFQTLLSEGLGSYQAGSFPQAFKAFTAASVLDSQRGDAQFAIARILDTLKRNGEAHIYYTRARDYDQLRFRTSSDFNDVIKSMNGNGVWIADVEEAFRTHSPDSLVGTNLILEHLHPTLSGYFLIGNIDALVMRNAGLLASSEEWNRADTISDSNHWESRAITDLDIYAASKRIETLTSDWPFRRPIVPASKEIPPGIRTIAGNLLAGDATWEQTHVSAAEFYEQSGDFVNSAREYRALVSQFPMNVSPYLRLASVYHRIGNMEKAQEALRRSLNIEMTYFALVSLGSREIEQANNAEALRHIELALQYAANNSELTNALYLQALAQSRIGKRSEAIATLQRVLRIEPGFQPANQLLRQLNKR